MSLQVKRDVVIRFSDDDQFFQRVDQAIDSGSAAATAALKAGSVVAARVVTQAGAQVLANAGYPVPPPIVNAVAAGSVGCCHATADSCVPVAADALKRGVRTPEASDCLRQSCVAILSN